MDDYNEWKLHNGDKYNKNKKITEITDDSEDQVNNADSDEPPYSSNYQKLVELIVSGKPVPGIKQIPDTVVPDQSSKPEAKQRLKPWEIKAQENNEE